MRARPFPIAQDQDFNIQVFTQIKTIVSTEEVLYYWVQHNGQVSQRARYVEILPDFFYRNYIDHQPENDSFDYILLNQLYRRMALLKVYSVKSDSKKYYFGKSKFYYKNTIQKYLKEKRIPNTDKAKYLIGYHLPLIVRLVFDYLDKHPKVAGRFTK